jgi:hypothetical protein
MDFVESILQESRVRYREYRSHSPSPIWLTSANQLMASYKVLARFAIIDRHYAGWRAHHVVEKEDLERLGVASRFPGYEEQLTVLLPQVAQIRRINSIMRNQASMGAALPAQALLTTYASAYSLMGNYSGGGEEKIRTELMSVARAIFRRAGVM